MKKIYSAMENAQSAYILHSGKLIFEITLNDRYQVEGREIIFGAEEPLIVYKTRRHEYLRFQTVYVNDDASVDQIPAKNLYKVMSVYNIGYNVTKNIARYVEITNRIYFNKEKKLSGKEMVSKEYAKIYAETVDELKAAYQKLKIPWLKQILERFTNSLVYTKGIAFKKSTAKSDLKLQMEKLSDYTFDLRVGSILCEESDEGNEMFILNRGSLEVFIGGQKVANINESGTVIGEMALLLGRPRTATVKTTTDCNITIIKSENLKEVGNRNKNFFFNIAVNLSRRLDRNCSLIRETNDLLRESMSSDSLLPPMERTNYKELISLLRELERYYIKYKNDWMASIVNGAKKEINSTRTLYT